MSSVLESDLESAYAHLPWLDIQGERYKTDAHTLLAEVRRESEIIRTQRGIEFLSHAALERISKDRTFETPTSNYFAKKGAGPVALEMFDQGMIVHMEATRHLQHRKAFVTAFSKAKVGAQTDAMREIAEDLVDRFVADRRCELIDQFTHLYSISVLCRTLGVAMSDVPTLAKATLSLHWLLAFDIRPGYDELESALLTLQAYVCELFDRRRAEPGDDFMSVLVLGQEQSGLTDDEIIWNFVNMLFAGHDTTRFQLAALVHTLIFNDAWGELAADPELISSGIAEAMRLNPIVQYRTRVATEESEVDGLTLLPGTNLAMNWLAAMRDPARFENPQEFVLRRPIDRRLDFGAGVHRCIGEGLASAEIDVAVRILTSRISNPVIDGAIHFRPYDTGIGGPEALPLTFG